MFHKRCDREIKRLESLLDYERERNQALEEKVAILQEKPFVPVGSNRPANVYYMDDARLAEMESNGDVPT
jgi:hypothetical protein